MQEVAEKIDFLRLFKNVQMQVEPGEIPPCAGLSPAKSRYGGGPDEG